MNLQEQLEEMLRQVETIRAVQVQFLAESDRAPEQKLHHGRIADRAWRRYHEIHAELTGHEGPKPEH